MSIHLQTHFKPVSQPSLTHTLSSLSQRQRACGQHTGGSGKYEPCRKKREGTLQCATGSPWPVNDVPPIVPEVICSPGQPLDPTTRAFMEPRFGHDFSQVRPHTATPRMAKAELVIGPVNDRFEREADRVAETVIRLPGLGASDESGLRAGFDFSQVWVHTDARTAESARAVNILPIS